MITNVFETEPDFVNDLGVKWWQDKETTAYAQRPDVHGTTLDVTVWYVETAKNPTRTRIISNSKGDMVYAHQQLESIACHIDALKLMKRVNA